MGITDAAAARDVSGVDFSVERRVCEAQHVRARRPLQLRLLETLLQPIGGGGARILMNVWVRAYSGGLIVMVGASSRCRCWS